MHITRGARRYPIVVTIAVATITIAFGGVPALAKVLPPDPNQTAAGAPAEPAEPTTTVAPTTSAAHDPCDATAVPIGSCANGPAVAAIQGRLNITVDCDFGGQTERAVRDWQAESGQPVTGVIDAGGWALLAVPTTWGDDANGNGTIEPSEVTLVCDGDVELPPPPVDTTGWPNTTLAMVAEICGVSDEWTDPQDNEAPDYRYSPTEDTITIFGAGAEDHPDGGDAVLDVMVCVLGTAGVPDHVINQISSTRALDGMQSAEWDGMAAQWTYYPDAGMNLTIWAT